MTTVITGPFTIVRKQINRSIVQTSSMKHTVTTFRSKPVTNRPNLAHTSVLSTQILKRGPANSNLLTCNGGWVSQIVNTNWNIQTEGGYARAYDKFYGEANGSAQVGLALLEAKASLAMAEKRLIQFTTLFKGILTRDFRLVSKAIGNTRKSRETFRKTKGQPISECYIEWLFGWKPIIDDVYNAAGILGRDFHGNMIVSKAKMSGGSTVPIGNTVVEKRSYKTRYKISGRLVVTNPNLLLAQQMGLTNPAALVWEAIPFSFLVNWFVPVGKFFASWDKNLGIRFDDLIVTYHLDAYCNRVDSTWTVWENDFFGHRFQRFTPTSLVIPTFASRLRVPTFELMDGLGRLSTLAALAHLVFKNPGR